ncbi:MAG: hypothetical protein JNM86_10025 [Phycisphaerae bacterium]|nr:hypothetical protein [Phycisphaerae bacterium]
MRVSNRQRKLLRTGAIALVLLFSAGTSGCASDRGYVQRQWSGTFRELGIVPIFPPREDVYVGDVYATAYDPEDIRIQNLMDKKYSAMTQNERALRLQIGVSPPLARLNLNCEAYQTYANTPSWPATTTDYNTILGGPTPESLAAPIAQQKQIVEDRNKEIAGFTTQFDTATAERRTLSDATPNLTSAQTRAQEDFDSQKLVTDGLRARRSKLTADFAAATTDTERNDLLTQIGKIDQSIKDAQAILDARETTLTKAKQALADNAKAIETLDARLKDLAAKKAAAEKARDLALKNIEELKAFAAAAGTNTAFRREPRDPTYDVFRNGELPDPPTPPPGDPSMISDNALQAGDEEQNEDQSPKGPTPAQRRAARDEALLARADDLANSRVNRLKLVGFPDFAATTFTQGELSALVPIEGFALGVRGNFANLKSVSVKVPAAESYSVPLYLVQKRVVEPATLSIGDLREELRERIMCLIAGTGPSSRALDAAAASFSSSQSARLDPQGRVPTLGRIRTELRRTLRANDIPWGDPRLEQAAEQTLMLFVLFHDRANQKPDAKPSEGRLVQELIDGAQFQFPAPTTTDDHPLCDDDRYFYLRVITEVYYARALDVSLITKSSFGARAELEALINAETRERTDPIDFQNPQPTGSLTKDPATLTSADMVSMTEHKLGQRLKVPGGFVQLVSYSDTTIGLRRVYERPIAIGFRGMTLKVERGTGRVAGMVASNSGVPAAR